MRVAELMQRNVRTIPPDATIAEAVTALADAHVSALPVVNGSGKVVGVISASDVLEAEAELTDGTERERLFDMTQVEEVMTPTPLVTEPGVDVRAAARQMLRQGIHRLFVEEHGRLVGVISQTDIVRAVAASKV